MQHNRTKVALSKDELELVNNAQILLTKNEIVRKVYELFGLLAEDFSIIVKEDLPFEVLMVAPKISKGENYEGLPYVMLDYPRYFKKVDTLAIRTFFWWGNFFSITLQLSGQYKNIYEEKLQQAIRLDIFSDWFINVGESEWDHHFRETNYQQINNQTSLIDKKVIKVATKIPLIQWDDVQFYLSNSFLKIMETLRS